MISIDRPPEECRRSPEATYRYLTDLVEKLKFELNDIEKKLKQEEKNG